LALTQEIAKMTRTKIVLKTQAKAQTFHGASARFTLAHQSHWTPERRAHFYAVMEAQIAKRSFSQYPR
jgi:hypothetical protein